MIQIRWHNSLNILKFKSIDLYYSLVLFRKNWRYKIRAIHNVFSSPTLVGLIGYHWSWTITKALACIRLLSNSWQAFYQAICSIQLRYLRLYGACSLTIYWKAIQGNPDCSFILCVVSLQIRNTTLDRKFVRNISLRWAHTILGLWYSPQDNVCVFQDIIAWE